MGRRLKRSPLPSSLKTMQKDGQNTLVVKKPKAVTVTAANVFLAVTCKMRQSPGKPETDSFLENPSGATSKCVQPENPGEKPTDPCFIGYPKALSRTDLFQSSLKAKIPCYVSGNSKSIAREIVFMAGPKAKSQANQSANSGKTFKAMTR